MVTLGLWCTWWVGQCDCGVYGVRGGWANVTLVYMVGGPV